MKEYLTPRLKVMNQDELSTLFAQWNQFLQPPNINDGKEGIEAFSNRILLSNLYDFYTNSPMMSCYTEFESLYDTNSAFLIRIIMKSIQIFDQHSNTPIISFSAPFKVLLKWLRKNEKKFASNIDDIRRSSSIVSYESDDQDLLPSTTSGEDSLVSFSSEMKFNGSDEKLHKFSKEPSNDRIIDPSLFLIDKKLWMNIVYIMKSMKRYIPEKLAGVIRTCTHCIFQIAYNLDGHLQQIMMKTFLYIENYEGPSIFDLDDSNKYLINPITPLQKASHIYMISVFLERYLQNQECNVKHYCDLAIDYFMTFDKKKSESHTEKIIKENSNFYLAVESFFDLFIKLDYRCYDIQTLFTFLIHYPSPIIYDFFAKYHLLIDMSIFEQGQEGFKLLNNVALVCGKPICRFQFLNIIIDCKPDFDIQKLFDSLQLDKNLRPSHICSHLISILSKKPELMNKLLKQHIFELANSQNVDGNIFYLIIKLRDSLFSDFPLTEKKLANYPSLQLESLKWIDNVNERNDKLLRFVLIDSNASSSGNDLFDNLRLQALDFLVPTEQLSKNSIFYSLLYDYSFKVRKRVLSLISSFNTKNIPINQNELNYHELLTEYLEYLINALTNNTEDVQYISEVGQLIVFFCNNLTSLEMTSYSTILIDLILSLLSQRYSINPHSNPNNHSNIQSTVSPQQSQTLSFVPPPSTSILTPSSNETDQNENLDDIGSIFPDSFIRNDSLSPPEEPSLNVNHFSSIQSQASSSISTTSYQQDSKSKSKTLLKDHIIQSINEEFYLKRDKYLLKSLCSFGELCKQHLDKILHIFYSIFKLEKNEDFLNSATKYLNNLAFILMPSFNLHIAKPELQAQLIHLLKKSTLVKLKVSILKLMGSCFDYIKPSESSFGKSFSTPAKINDTSQSMIDTIFRSLMSNDFENHWFGMKILAVIFENEYEKASRYAYDFAQKVINFLTPRSNSPHDLYQYLTLVLTKCPNAVIPNLLPEIKLLIEQRIYERECLKMCVSICNLVTKSGNDIVINDKTYSESSDNLYFKFMDFITQTYDLVLEQFLTRDTFYFKWAIRFISLSIVKYNLSVDSFFRYLSRLQSTEFLFQSFSHHHSKGKLKSKKPVMKPYTIEIEIIRCFIYLVQNRDLKLYISSIITIAILLQKPPHFGTNQNEEIENESRKKFNDSLTCLYKSLIVYQNYHIHYNFLLNSPLFDCTNLSKTDLKIIDYKRNLKTIESKWIKKDNFFIDLFPIETENITEFIGRLIFNTFLYSPNPIYRSFSDYIQSIWRLTCRIFPQVFLSLWEQCSEEDRNHFSAILNYIFQKKNLIQDHNHELMDLIEYLDIQGYQLNIDYMIVAQITPNYYYSFIIIQRYFIDNRNIPISIFPKVFQICQKANQKSTFRALFQIFEPQVDQITAGNCYAFLGNWDHALKLYEDSDAPLPKRLLCLFSLRRYNEIVNYYDKLDSLLQDNRKETLQSLTIFLWTFLIRGDNKRIEELLNQHNFIRQRNLLYPQIIHYITTQNYNKAIELIETALKKLLRYDFEKGDMYGNQKKANKLRLLSEFGHVINSLQLNCDDISEIWTRCGDNIDCDSWMWQQLILARSLLKPIDSNQMSYLPMISALRKSGHFDIIHQYFSNTLDQITQMPFYDERLKLEWNEGFNIDSYLGIATTMGFGLIRNIHEFIYLIVYQKLPLPGIILQEISRFDSDIRDYITNYHESNSFDNAMTILQKQPIATQRNFFGHLAVKFPQQMFILYMKNISLHNYFSHLCHLTGKFASRYDTRISYRYYNAARQLESEKISNWKGWAMANLALFMENLSRMHSPIVPSQISGSYVIGNEKQEPSILTLGSMDSQKMRLMREQQMNYQRSISNELGDLDLEEDYDGSYCNSSDEKEKSKPNKKFEKRIEKDMGSLDSQSSSDNEYNNSISGSESGEIDSNSRHNILKPIYHEGSSDSFNENDDHFLKLEENDEIQIDSTGENQSIYDVPFSDPNLILKDPFDSSNQDLVMCTKKCFISDTPVQITNSSDILNIQSGENDFESVQTIDIAEKILSGEANEMGQQYMMQHCESYNDKIEQFLSLEIPNEGNETIEKRRDLLNECSADFVNFLSRSDIYSEIDSTIEYEAGRKLGLDLIEACLKIVEYDGKFSFEYLVLLFFVLFTITSNDAPTSSRDNPYGPFKEIDESDTTDSDYSSYRYHDDDGDILPKKLEYRILSLAPKMIVDMLPQISLHISTDTTLVEKLYICAAHEDFQSVFFSLNLLSKNGSKRATEIINKLKSFRSFSRFESNVADINSNLRSTQFPSINKAIQMRHSRSRMPMFSLPFNSSNQMKGFEENCDNSISYLIEECMLLDEGLIQLSQSIFERWLDGLEAAPKSVFNCDNILLSLFKDANNPATELDKLFVNQFGDKIRECEELFKKHSNATLQEMWAKLNQLYREINSMMNRLNYVTLKDAAPILSNHSFKAIQIPGHHKSKTATVTRRLSQISSIKQMYSLDNSTPFAHLSSLLSAQDFNSNLGADENAEYLSTIDEKVEIVASSQRPKSIVFNSSSGKKFKFLLKSNQDLRIDQRIMQFFSLVNTFLHKTFKAKADGNDEQQKSPMLYTLDIKVYTILPLRKNCGLISFVNNSESFFNLVEERRKINGQRFDLEKNLDMEFTGRQNSFKLMNNLQKYEFFNYVAENTKANELFESFFHKALSTSEAIGKMRAFAKSLGLMSIIGHVIGLGDRHPSNILIDISNGSVVHIDFADCFEVTQKRRDFPEKVPFRLTRMFIKALQGNTSSGEFEDTSIAVMKLMRKEKASLAVQLTIFLMESQKDRTAIERIIDKLSGKEFDDDDVLFEKEKDPKHKIDQHSYPQINLRKYTSPTITLSVEDQVHKLIEIAQDPINYCSHFPGWCPFW